MNFRDLIDKIAEAEAPTAAPAAPVWTPTPEQATWLGKADQQDPYILSRMPGQKPPISWFKDPADQALAKRMGFPEKAPAAPVQPAQQAADDQGLASAREKMKQLMVLLAKVQPGAKNAPGLEESIKADIAKQLVESFGYATEAQGASLGQQAAAGAAGFGGAKVAGKMLGKAIPGVGLAFGAADAYDRAKKGDYVGAGMAGLSGLASLVPGVGTAAALGLDAANLARDYKAGDFDSPQTAAAAKTGTTVPKGDPKVLALQQKLIAKGAQIKADGIMGPRTQAAMKQFGMTNESLAESMSDLRAKLAMIEAEQQADEGVVSNLASLGKNFAGGLKGWNVAGQQAAKGAVDAAGKKIGGKVMKATGAERAANAAGKAVAGAGTKVAGAVARNPVKTAVAGAALGGLSGLAFGGKEPAASPTGTTTPSQNKPAGGQSGAETGATTPELDQETMAQISVLMAELAQYDIPEIQQGLVQARQMLAKATGDANVGSADKAAPAASSAPAPVVQATGDAAKDNAARQAGNVVQYK